MYFDTESYTVGIGWGLTLPESTKAKADPKTEFVGWGPGLLSPKMLHTLPSTIDEMTATFGPRVYEAMLTDAAVAAAVGSLKLGILDGGVSLTPTHPMPALAKSVKAKPAGESDGKAPAPAKGTPDQESSKLAHEFCQRTLDRLGENLLPQLYSLMDAMSFGVKLAEVTCTVPTEGEDAGKLVIDTFKVRPNRAWRFMVDAFMNVKGVLTWNTSSGAYEVVAPEKFAWATWMPVDSDPRGTSLLRAAYTAWNLKVQTWPMLYSHSLRFGSPGIDVEMAENDTEERQPLDEDGNEDATADPVSSTQYAITAARLYKSGGVIAHPNGSKVAAFESKGDGSALREMLNTCNREIATAIEFQAKVMMEAEHSNKSQGQVGQDTKSLVNSYGRSLAAGVVRRVLRNNLADNFGAEFADRFTPQVTFGEAETNDLPAMLTAAGSVGYTVGPSMLPEMDAMFGLPVRDPEEDARHAEEALKQQTDAAVKVKGDTAGAANEKTAKPAKGTPAK